MTLRILVCYFSIESAVSCNIVSLLVTLFHIVLFFVLFFVLVLVLTLYVLLSCFYYYCYSSPKGQERVKVGK